MFWMQTTNLGVNENEKDRHSMFKFKFFVLSPITCFLFVKYQWVLTCSIPSISKLLAKCRFKFERKPDCSCSKARPHLYEASFGR